MKKILQISNYLYPHIGGIEQVAKDISDVIAENNDFQQKIICFNEDAKDGNFICHRKENAKDTINGVEVIRCGCFAKVASQSLSFSYPSMLATEIKNFNPDIVILHYPNPFVSLFLLHLLPKKTKFILYWHLDITKQKFLGKIFHLQNIALCKRADIIVATSPNYIEGSPYLSKFKNKCIVIPNCIRPERMTVTDEIKTKADEIRKKYKNTTVCFAVGRHVPYKGMEYLVKASKYLDGNFAVLIGGNGELTEALKTEAENDKKVEFLGRISDEDLVAYYIACDVFCFPSITKNEAFGIALAEGMYFSKPAVTFTINGSGVNFVSLDGVTGIECQNGNSKEFAEAVKTLRDNPDLAEKYGINAKKRVEENFMFDKFKITVNGLFKNI